MPEITFELPALCENYLTYEKVIQPSRFVSYQSGDRTERREHPGKREIVLVPGISSLIRDKKYGTILVSISETTLPLYCEIEVIRHALKTLQSSLDNFLNDPKITQEKVREAIHCLANYLKLDSEKHLSKYIAASMLVWLTVFVLVFPVPMLVVSLMLAVVIGLIMGSIISLGKDIFDARIAHKKLYKATGDLEKLLEEGNIVGRTDGSTISLASDRAASLPSVSDDSDNVLMEQELQDKSLDYANGSTLTRSGIFKENPWPNIPAADSHISFNRNVKHF